MHFDKPYRGVLSGLAAFFCFSAMDITIKLMAKGYALPLVIFMQSGIILLIMFGCTRVLRMPFLIGSHYPYRQFVRVIFHVLAGYCGYSAFTQMPLATFYTVGFLGPLLISLMAWFVYAERPSLRTWIALAMGFVGMVIIARPDTLPMTPPTFFAFVWIFFSAVNVMFVRSMPLDHPNTFTIYTHTMMLTCVSFFAIPHLAEFDIHDIIYPIMGGTFTAAANYFFYSAYKWAPSSLVAPTQYTQIIWGALAGWFVFDASLTMHLWVGALFIGGAGWLVVSQSRGPVNAHTQRRVMRGFGMRFSTHNPAENQEKDA